MAFYTVKIYITQYLLLMAALWILLWFNYSIKNNIEIYEISTTVSLGNLLSYTTIHDYFKMEINNLEIEIIIFFIILLMSFLISICVFKLRLSKTEDQISENVIYKRKKDLKRLKDYFKEFNIVGVNGVWGSGKSFVINELKKHIKEEYEIIEIDVLTCNLNELQLILLKEIEKIMNKNRVLSKYSNKLKDFLMSEKNFSNISKIIFPENYSYSETINGLKDEVKKVDKKIVIIYEDIDRITDKKIIESIFGLSEKLSNADIKIIYQYDENKLAEIGFNTEYLEKYIPYKMNLTEISFFEALNIVLAKSEIDDEILKDSDFDYLWNYEQGSRFIIIEQKLGIKNIENLSIKCSSIRKVESYIMEIYGIVQNEKYRKYKETIISFFTIKHFFSEVYEKLNIEEEMSQLLKFKVDLNLYSIEEVIELFNQEKLNKDKINEIFSDEDNRKNYTLLRFFNFNFENKLTDKKDKNAFATKNFKYSVNNESINRIIWNLLASGKSQYTDYEYIGQKLIGEVLNQPKNKQIEAYNTFWGEVYIQNKDEIDNETIFMMSYSDGNSDFGELFKAFRIWETSEKEKIALIDLYIDSEKIEFINDQFIKSMTFCSLTTRKEFIHILEKIGELKVIHKLKYDENLIDFLQKYIRSLEKFGYIRVNRLDVFVKEYFESHKDLVCRELQTLINNIQELKIDIFNFTKSEDINRELQVIIIFLNKMVELVNCKLEDINEKKKQVDISFSANPLIIKNYERLKNLLDNKEEFGKEVENSYLNGDINIDLIRRLLGENIN